MGKSSSGYMNAKELAEESAFVAIKRYKQQEREQIRKSRFHNMGLLLNHYLDFLDHYENIKYNASDIQEDLAPAELEMVDQEDIVIFSIKKSKVRTKIMILQIETSVRMLKIEMENKKEVEKYNVIEKLYMDRSKKDLKFNQKILKVAEELNCSESSVRRWNSEMMNKLATKLFGIDGLMMEVWDA